MNIEQTQERQARAERMEKQGASMRFKRDARSGFTITIEGDDDYFRASSFNFSDEVVGHGCSIEEALVGFMESLNRVMDQRDPVELAIWNMPDNPSINDVALIADAMGIDDVNVITWLRKRHWDEIETVEYLIQEWENQ